MKIDIKNLAALVAIARNWESDDSLWGGGDAAEAEAHPGALHWEGIRCPSGASRDPMGEEPIYESIDIWCAADGDSAADVPHVEFTDCTLYEAVEAIMATWRAIEGEG